MKRMVIAAAMAWAGPSGAALADEARERALATEVMRLMDMEETIGGMFTELAPVMAMAIAPSLNAEGQELARLEAILAEEFTAATPRFVEFAVDGYVDALSEQELSDIVTFLNSPSGRAMTEADARIQASMGPAAEQLGGEVAVRAVERFRAK